MYLCGSVWAWVCVCACACVVCALRWLELGYWWAGLNLMLSSVSGQLPVWYHMMPYYEGSIKLHKTWCTCIYTAFSLPSHSPPTQFSAVPYDTYVMPKTQVRVTVLNQLWLHHLLCIFWYYRHRLCTNSNLVSPFMLVRLAWPSIFITTMLWVSTLFIMVCQSQ